MVLTVTPGVSTVPKLFACENSTAVNQLLALRFLQMRWRSRQGYTNTGTVKSLET